MPDFPIAELQDSTHDLFTYGADTLLGQQYMVQGIVFTSATWTNSNTALFSPVVVSTPFLAQKMAVQVGTSSGNLDMGIYSEQGVRLVSKGSTAVAAAGLQVVDITDTWLMPGTYFVAMNCDNTTAAFFGVNLAVGRARISGVLQQAVGAIALPATATFATYSSRVNPVIMVSGVPTV